MSEFEQRTSGKTELSEYDRKSVEILNNLQEHDDFRARGGFVHVYFENACTPFVKYTIEDLFKAVDFYYEHRDIEFRVDMAMMKPDGHVNLYSSRTEGQEPVVILSIKNYKVPQILEFAYLLARREIKNTQK